MHEKVKEILDSVSTSKNIIKINVSEENDYEEYFSSIRTWCFKNCSAEFILSDNYIWFKTKNDAIKFKLQWS